MELTSRQLKDALVFWCMEVWKTSGTSITTEQAAQMRCEIEFSSQESPDEEEPGMEIMIVWMDGGYLQFTLDDNPTATGELLQTRQMLDRFIQDHPEIAAGIDPLLDADIIALCRVASHEGSKLESVDRDEKIRLVAKYRLMLDGDSNSTEEGANNEPDGK